LEVAGFEDGGGFWCVSLFLLGGGFYAGAVGEGRCDEGAAEDVVFCDVLDLVVGFLAGAGIFKIGESIVS